jgi:RHS repeat-associated protein
MIHNDHLGTPQKMTKSDDSIVWSADYKPFGEASITATDNFTNNLRFPGQYYDTETGLNYNYFRDYNPVIGRYLEADLIGLNGGLNLFIYAENTPQMLIDELGLEPSGQYSISRGQMTVTDSGIVLHQSGGWVSGRGSCQNRPTPICLSQQSYGPIPPGDYISSGRPSHRPTTTTRRFLTPKPNDYSNIYLRGWKEFLQPEPFETHWCEKTATCSEGCPAQPNWSVIQNFNNILSDYPNMPIKVVP